MMKARWRYPWAVVAGCDWRVGSDSPRRSRRGGVRQAEPRWKEKTDDSSGSNAFLLTLLIYTVAVVGITIWLLSMLAQRG